MPTETPGGETILANQLVDVILFSTAQLTALLSQHGHTLTATDGDAAWRAKRICHRVFAREGKQTKANQAFSTECGKPITAQER